ncbi:MAG: hypothetical protein AAGA80_02390 [Cyanobacteria bacterium P01_F01_bin.143]
MYTKSLRQQYLLDCAIAFRCSRSHIISSIKVDGFDYLPQLLTKYLDN